MPRSDPRDPAGPAGLCDPAPDVGRRGFLAVAGAGLLTGALAGCGGGTSSGGSEAKKTTVPERKDDKELTYKEARKRLEEGNLRFVEGKTAHPDQSASRRKRLGTDGQKPFAIVLSCADSRVPPEVVFDQGLGDLFVVRSAGQVVDSAVLGSLQYAVHELEPPLLVVLGHSGCGAVKATIEALESKSAATGSDIDALVAAITPSVKEAEELGAKGTDLLPVAVDSNVERVVAQLSDAKIINVAAKSRRMRVLGAVYDLASGEVVFS